jgi:hypothetical protein
MERPDEHHINSGNTFSVQWIAELERHNAELKAALRPFAEAAQRTLASHPSTADSSVEVWNGVTWGNFARAAELVPERKE